MSGMFFFFLKKKEALCEALKIRLVRSEVSSLLMGEVVRHDSGSSYREKAEF